MSDLTTIATGILPASGYQSKTVYGIVPTNPNTTGIAKTAFDFTSGRNGPAYRTNENGVLEEMGNDVCRVEYPSCPSLLLEPASSNLVLWSEDLSNAWWTKAGSTVVYEAISEIGLPAFKFIPDNGVTNAQFGRSNLLSETGETFTRSFYVKSAGIRYLVCSIIAAGATSTRTCVFDTETNTFTQSGTLILDKGSVDLGNGVYRVWFTAVNDATTNDDFYFAPSADGLSGLNYTGNGVDGFYISGLQCELGTTPTTYIKTEATTVTRPQDTLVQAVPNSDMYNDDEGVLMIDGLFSQDGYITLLAGTDTTNSITIASVGGDLGGIVQATTTQANLTTTIDASIKHKVELRYKANEFSLWVDGVKEDEDLGGLTPTGLDNIKFNDGNGGSSAFGSFSSVVYLPGESVVVNYALNFLKAQTDDILATNVFFNLDSDLFVEWRIKWPVLSDVSSYCGTNDSTGGYPGNFRCYVGYSRVSNGILVGFGDGFHPSEPEFPVVADTWYKIRIEYTRVDTTMQVLINDVDAGSRVISSTPYTMPTLHIAKYSNPDSYTDAEIDYINYNGVVFNFPEGSGTTTKNSAGTDYPIISDRVDPNQMWINLD